jgi:hypothetical protein
MRALTCSIAVALWLTSAQINAEEEAANMTDPDTRQAIALMMGFAERTALTSDSPPRRYLWTDAFAVCNLLGLARQTGEASYRELALALIDQVHHTLGRHRPDDPRTGWISGLNEREGEAHPTRGGLRIGKALPERGEGEPFDERLEWDRDGQYFHYLTQWMHALDQAARATGEPRYNLWARELAQGAQHAFTYRPFPGARTERMYWKMSIDLTRPLVASMGQHDPLSGYLAAIQLHATAARLPGPQSGPSLEDETRRFAAMVENGRWATPDPLGIGGLLIDTYRVQQLMQEGALPGGDLLVTLLSAALAGLEHYARTDELHLPADYRLAFRELGLAIGLQAVERMEQAATGPEVRARLQALMPYAPMGETITSFWRDPGHQTSRTWVEHRDINEVMLATGLAPEGYLVLVPPP